MLDSVFKDCVVKVCFRGGSAEGKLFRRAVPLQIDKFSLIITVDGFSLYINFNNVVVIIIRVRVRITLIESSVNWIPA